MKNLRPSQLVPGMVVAEDLFDFNNQLILSKGQILTDSLITRLAFYSIYQVKIEDEITADVANMDHPYSEKVKSSPEYAKFKKQFEQDVRNFKNVMNTLLVDGSPIDISMLLENTIGIFNFDESRFSVFDMLHNMRDYDDATYAHCMNVALICNMFARWLRLSPIQIKEATISGMLHDIGKVKIPDSIIKKPAKLTESEFEVIKTHPRQGYDLLASSKMSDTIRNAVLLHHERFDGSGYPFGLFGNKLGLYTKMVSIADVYDAMTSARVYRGPLCPFAAVKLFEDEGFQKYDPELILTFLNNVVNTYLLTDVRLSNGAIGKVVLINKAKLSRPTIKTYEGFIDLTAHPELEIEALI